MSLGVHLGATHDSGLQRKLGDLLAQQLAAADVLGRIQILRHAHAKTGKRLPLATHGRLVRFAEDDKDQTQQTWDSRLGISFDVGGPEAAKRIRDLTPVTRATFDGLQAHYQRDAFTLAGTSDLRLIERVRDALGDTAKNGGTVQDFTKAVNKLTTDASVENLSAFSLDTAFQTCMQKAYSAGRLDQMQEPHMIDAMPFWQYWTVGDLRVRPEHAVLDGFIASAVDPVWRKIYPPSGFNCRCSVVPLVAEEALSLCKDAADDGLMRLPVLAHALVPQRGLPTVPPEK